MVSIKLKATLKIKTLIKLSLVFLIFSEYIFSVRISEVERRDSLQEVSKTHDNTEVIVILRR